MCAASDEMNQSWLVVTNGHKWMARVYIYECMTSTDILKIAETDNVVDA